MVHFVNGFLVGVVSRKFSAWEDSELQTSDRTNSQILFFGHNPFFVGLAK